MKKAKAAKAAEAARKARATAWKATAAAAAELRAKKEEETKAKEVLGKVRKVLDANRHAVHAVATKYARAKVSEVTLDTESPHVKRFVELASSYIAGDADIMLGYHGTSVDRAEAIVTGGFCPTKRVAALGAYFSGVPEESYQHAGKHDSRGSILLVALIRDGYKRKQLRRTPDSLQASGRRRRERTRRRLRGTRAFLVHVRGVCSRGSEGTTGSRQPPTSQTNKQTKGIHRRQGARLTI